MSKELDIAGGASIGGWLRWRKKHAVEPGTPCSNCETPLQGAYCHVCGQLAEDFHRSIWHLVLEGLESFFHFDGRLAHTFPKLIAAPGRLTRAFLDGKRANQVPPLRLFLVLLLIAFFVGECSGQKTPTLVDGAPTAAKKREDVKTALKKEGIVVDPAGKVDVSGAIAKAQAEEAAKAGKKPDKVEVASLENPGGGKTTITVDPKAEKLNKWVTERVQAIQDDPQRFGMIMKEWAHRIAVLALPISALLLSILFVFQRRFYVYDHLIFSMHSLSFQLLLLSVIMGLQPLVGGWVWWGILLMPVHLFVHMRGVYASSVFGTLLRMFLLFWGSVFGFGFLALAWFWIGLSQMVGH